MVTNDTPILGTVLRVVLNEINKEIKKKGHGLTRGQLMERTGLGKRSVGYAIRKLVKKNLIEISYDIQDMRKRFYGLKKRT